MDGRTNSKDAMDGYYGWMGDMNGWILWMNVKD